MRAKQLRRGQERNRTPPHTRFLLARRTNQRRRTRKRKVFGIRGNSKPFLGEEETGGGWVNGRRIQTGVGDGRCNARDGGESRGRVRRGCSSCFGRFGCWRGPLLLLLRLSSDCLSACLFWLALSGLVKRVLFPDGTLDAVTLGIFLCRFTLFNHVLLLLFPCMYSTLQEYSLETTKNYVSMPDNLSQLVCLKRRNSFFLLWFRGN